MKYLHPFRFTLCLFLRKAWGGWAVTRSVAHGAGVGAGLSPAPRMLLEAGRSRSPTAASSVVCILL